MRHKDDSVQNFDATGRLIGIEDAYGRALTLSYVSGRLVTVTDDDSGRSLTFAYTGDRVTSVTTTAVTGPGYDGPLVWNYVYAGDLLTKVCDARDPDTTTGRCTAYGYTDDRLTSITRPRGNVSQRVHYRPADGKVDWSENGAGDRVTFTYQTRSTVVRDGRGNDTTYEFDHLYRTTQIVDPVGGTTIYQYDANGFRSAITDPNGNVARLTYDVRANLTSETNGEGETTLRLYDPDDNLVASRDGRTTDLNDTRFETSYTYNSQGDRLTETSPPTAEHPSGVTRRWTYTAGGEDFGWGPVPPGLLRSTNPGRGADTLYEYDFQGDVRRRVDPSGLVTGFEHDTLGRVLTTTTAWDGGQSATTSTAYDQLSNVVSILEPAVTNTAASTPVGHRRETVHVYDPNANLASTTVRDVDPGTQTPGNQTFGHTGAAQSFVVPDGITSLTVDMAGAEGGAGIPTTGGGLGGAGGRLQATLTVTPGETLLVRVGGVGGSTAAGGPAGGAGGYYAGAPGGTGATAANAGGGGGGGATDIRRGGTGDSSRVLVAGGGGGGANNSSAAGAGGAVLDTQATASSPAAPGGNGSLSANGAGGGGGGWRGGAGGAGGSNPSPGGGGTSMADTGQTSASTPGFRAGNGYVTLSWVLSQAPDPALDRVTTFTYDDAERLVSTTDPAGGTTTRTFDANGNVATVTDPEGRTHRTTYDASDRPTMLTLEGFVDDVVAGGTPRDVVLRRTDYDAAGRVTAQSTPAPNTGGRAGQLDPAGTPMVTRSTAYDRADRPTSVTLLGYHNRSGVSPATRDVVVEASVYDDAGNRITETAGGGLRTVSHVYDEAGVLQSSTLELGAVDRLTEFDRDAAGNLTLTRQTEGASIVETRVAFDDANRPVETTVENGGDDLTATVAYDRRGLRLATVDPRGNAPGADAAAFRTDFVYDVLGRLVTETSPPVTVEAVGGTPTTARPQTRHGYDNFGNRDTTVDARGNRTITTHDLLDRVVRIDHPAYARPDNQTLTPYETFTFDAVGNVVARRDRRGHTTDFTFDDRNRVVQRVDPLLAGASARGVWDYAYDDAGPQVAATDPTGAMTRQGHDDLGRVRTTTAEVRQPTSASFTTTVDYDDLGNQTYRIDPAGVTATATFDAASRQLTAVDAVGETTAFDYDVAGRVTSVRDPLDRVIEHVYDQAGRETSTVHRDGPGGPVLATTYQAHDPAGNLIAARSARSSSPTDDTYLTSWTYDALGRVIGTSAPDTAGPLSTSYGYDATGNVTRLTDGRGNRTTYSWTPWNQRATTTEPAAGAQAGTWTTTYDAGGLPVVEAEPGPVTMNRTFDNLGRLTEVIGTGTAASAANQTFDYDLAGRRTGVNHPAGAVTYAYDDRGLLLSSSVPGGATAAAAFSYDAAGRMTSRADAAGTTAFTYTDRGELDQVTDPLTGGVTDYDWNDAGQVATVRYGGGTPATRTLTYDGRGWLDVDTLTPSTGAPHAVDYGYDPDGNLTTQQVTAPANSAAGTHTYAYDRSGRLDTWTNPANVETDYGYDAAGNRTSVGSTTYTYDARNRLTGSAGPAGTVANTWTPRGTLAVSTLDPLQFKVALVVGNTWALTPADTAIRDRLTAAGHTVGLVEDSAPTATGVALVVIAESVDPAFVGSRYRNHPAGVLNLASGLWDDDGLTAIAGTALPNATNTVVTPSHPAVAGKTGSVTTTTTGNHRGVDDAVLGAGATQLLDRDGLPSINVEFAYDIGATRALGTGPAPARRVALGWNSGAITNLTADGGAIFDATVRWAGGAPVVTPSSFDALGRQTAVGATTYAFDGLDRITTRDPDAGGPTAPETFSYAGAELDPVAYGNQLYARTPAGELAALGVGTSNRFTVENRHGDLTTLLDPTGADTDTDIYDPYGTPVGETGTTDPAVGYQGDFTDPTSGQVWMGARWYQPGTATFTSRDTVFGQLQTPMSLNRYSYANSDPLEYFDPDGRGADSLERHTASGAMTPQQAREESLRQQGTADRAYRTEQDHRDQNRFNGNRTSSTQSVATIGATTRRTHATNTPTTCVASLNCSIADFTAMSIDEREAWLRDIEDTYALTFYLDNWFNNIYGVLDFARDHRLVETSQWFSTVDAGILQGVQEGLALAKGQVNRCIGRFSGDSGCNPGGAEWARFFELARDIGHPARTTQEGLDLRALWGPAEQSSTDYGRLLAEERYRLLSTPRLRTLLIGVGDMYRRVVGHPDAVPDTIRGASYSVYCAGADPMGNAIAGLFGDSCQNLADDFLLDAFDPRTPGLLRIAADAVWNGYGALDAVAMAAADL